MGQVVRRRSATGEVSYSARIRKLGYPSMYATFSRKTDAEAWIQEQERQIRLGIHLETPEAKKHTFDEANPVRDAKRYKESRGRIRFLSDDERTALLKACSVRGVA